MKINTDINIIGGLTDWSLLEYLVTQHNESLVMEEVQLQYSKIKTKKSVQRFERAARGMLLHYRNNNIKELSASVIMQEPLSQQSLLMLFWNASLNNDLFHYLNHQVYFPSFYSGRLYIKKEEVNACIKNLRETEEALKNWTFETIDTVARKYLALLKNFGLLKGTKTKEIIHPYLSDSMFVVFIYWLTAQNGKSNILQSEWIEYCFSEQTIFIERLMLKKYSHYYNFTYNGHILKIETLVPFSTIYHAIK